jgi:hypothetical protein
MPDAGPESFTQLEYEAMKGKQYLRELTGDQLQWKNKSYLAPRQKEYA